jgi:pilus assembly protein TadC
MKDIRLEMLSDMVRRGEPVNMSEAIEVVEYQRELKRLREEKRKMWLDILWNSTPIGWMISLFKNS